MTKEDLIKQYQTNITMKPLENCTDIERIGSEKLYFRSVAFAAAASSSQQISKHIYNKNSKQYELDIYLLVSCAGKNFIYNGTDASSIEGIITPLPRKNFFYPANQPEKSLWYNFDAISLGEYLRQDIEKFYIIPASKRIKEITNDHFGYAITWGVLAFFNLLMLMKLIYSHKKTFPI